MADGSLRFETDIDESGFNRGLDRLGRRASRTANDTADEARNAADTAERAARDAAEGAERAADQAGNGARRAGADVEQAARRASETVRRSSEETRRETERDAEESANSLKDLAMKAAGVVAGLGVADIAVDAAKAVATNANEMKKAMNQFAAATGTGTAELSGYQDVMEDIYKNNYGESFEDIGNAMASVKKQMEETNGSALQKTTESAFALRDVFGYEIEESVRASATMMDQFGVSSEAAMNLIANGAQNGLDYSGELIDSINEYSVQFAKLGLSADDMFSIFQSGADSGAWNLDKIGDAVKEFSIRAIDGSNTTIDGFTKLGMNADEMAQKFAAGGASARDAFQQVIQGLAGMDDPVEQSIAGVDLFGTMWEDLGPEVVAQLAEIGDGAYGTADALEQIKEVRYDDVTSSLATLGRTVMSEVIEPIADVALPAIKEVIDDITESLDPPKTIMEEMADSIDETAKSVNKLSGSIDGSMDDAAAEAQKIRAYKDIILKAYDREAASEEELAVKKEQTRLAVERLSGSVPALAASFDEETGSIRMAKDELEKLLENSAKLAEYNALETVKAQSDAALLDAQVNLEIAKGMREDAEAAKQDAVDAYKAAGAGQAQANAYLTGGVRQQTEAEKELEDALGKTVYAEEDAIKAEEEAQKAYDLAAKKNQVLADKIGETEAALGGEATAAELVAAANSQAAQAGEEASGAAEVQKDALESLKEKYTEFREQLEQDIQNKVSLFDAFDGGEDITVESMLENLKSQKEGLENWKANMEALANEVGTTITPEFYNAILEMGPEAANAVQHMVATLDQSNGRELLAQMAQEWGDALDFSGPAAENMSNAGKAVETGLMGVMNIAHKAGIVLPENLASGITNGKMDLTTATNLLGNVLSGGMDHLVQMAADAGVRITPEISAGLEAGGSEAVAAMQDLVALMQGEAAELADIGAQNGETLTQEATANIESGSSEMASAASEAGNKTGAEMQKSEAEAIKQNAGALNDAVDGSMRGAEDTALGYYDNFYTVGQNLMKGMVAGMTAESPAVETAARDAVKKAVEGARGQGEVASPSKVFKKEVGVWLSRGMAEGIRDGIGDVEQSSMDMADASLNAAKDELDIHSPSGVFQREVGAQIVKGIRKGIIGQKAKLISEVKALSESALKAAQAANGDYSDVGSSIMDNITEGLQKRQELASRKAEAIIQKYIDKVSSTGTVKRYEKRAANKENEADKLTKKAEELNKKGGDDNKKKAKQLEGQAKQLKKEAKSLEKKAEQYKKKFSEFGSSLMDAMDNAISAEFEKIQKNLETQISEISDKYQRAYDEIKSKRDAMFEKMTSPINFYDLDTQLEEVKRYQEGLKKLKGRIPDTLMDEILGMNLNEAVNFSTYLNSLKDTELEAYKKKWEDLQNSSEGFSNNFFSQQFADIKSGYEKEISDAMADAEEQMKSTGKNIVKGLITGLRSEKEVLSKECRKMAKAMIKQFKDAFGIKSPSKVMANQVGKYLPPGIAEGFDAALPDAERQITAGLEQAIASLQSRAASLQYVPAAPYQVLPAAPQVNVTNSQPVQVQAEIHTTVDLDGRTVGHVVTPYVNQNLGSQQTREGRGS